MSASPPSPWFSAHRERLRAAAGQGPIVDLACGQGRHALAVGVFAACIAIDRNAASLEALRTRARARSLPVQGVRADLETEHRIPLLPGTCGAILVFRFLYRPLLPAIRALLRPGGVLLYETFTRDQRELGWGPKRDAFLLERGELPNLCAGLEILEFEESIRDGAQREACAAILARRPA